MLRRSHVGPDNAAALNARVRLKLYALREAPFCRFRGHLKTLPGDIVFPAVIGASYATLFIATVPKRYAAVRAEFTDETDAALRVPKRQQLLGEHLHLDLRAVGFWQLRGEQKRNPVTPE